MKILFLVFLSSIAFAIASAYDMSFLDYSHQIKQPTGAAIIAYNRPQYLKVLLNSISQNPESQTLPFFFFLDGGDLEAQRENERLINETPLAHKVIIAREINYGCPKNHIDSKRFLFDWCHFDRIVVMEEDIVISKNYFQTLLAFHDWATAKYSNIGTVQLWSECRLSREDKSQYLCDVSEVALHWSLVTYCMGRNVWDDISPLLYRYEHFIDPFLGKEEYQIIRSKPGKGPAFREYKTWISKIAHQHNHGAAVARFGTDQWHSQFSVASWSRTGSIPMSQDQITTFSIWLAGYTRLQTTVNRVIHIGKEGISSKNHLLDIQLDEFPEEEARLQFRKTDLRGIVHCL